jgi:hypothetical protein
MPARDRSVQMTDLGARTHPFDLTRVHSTLTSLISYNTLVQCIHSRFSPKRPPTSGSESSSSEERMRGRPRFCKESATPPTIQRSIALIHREFVLGYVLVARGSSNLITSPGSTTRCQPGGRASLSYLVMVDRKDRVCTAWGA